ncbi:MAG: ATP-binding protein [Myxococcota bacterium]
MSSSRTSQAFRRRALIGLLTVAPVLAFALTLLIHQIPESVRGDSVDLSGVWYLRAANENDPTPSQAEALAGDGWTPLEVPGTYPPDRMPRNAWLTRTFSLPQELAQVPLSLVVGDTNGGVVAVLINGVHIGSFGDSENLRKSNFVGEYRLNVGPEAVRVGENVIALRLYWLTKAARIGGPHVLLGRASTVDVFHERRKSVWALLVYGPYAMAPLAALLLLAMALVDFSQESRKAYLANIWMLLSAAAYQDFLVGIASQWLSVVSRDCLIYMSIELFLVAVVAFIEAYFLRRITWFGKLSRAFAVFTLAVTALQLSGVSPLQTRDIYVATSPYSMIVAVYSIALAARAVVKGDRQFGLPLLVAASSLVVAGINDILRDLAVLNSPRLFVLALSLLPIIATATLLGDFLRIALTNQKLTRTLERRNQQLSAALTEAGESYRLKGEFLATVSHELRTPLNAIINLPEGLIAQFVEQEVVRCTACEGAFELEPGESVVPETMCPSCGEIGSLSVRRETTFQASSQDTRRYLEQITSNGKHLLRIVNDILDLSKLESGQMVLHAETVDVGPLLEDAKTMLSEMADRRSVSLQLSIEAGLASLRADPLRLSQAVLNLVTNAIKFSDAGSTVLIEAHSVSDQLTLAVSDRGIGISDKDQKIIFDSFRQAESSYSRNRGGSGLGLAITRQIVELHGGTISVQSELGAGSTFTIHLPFAAGPAAQPPSQ